MNDHAHRDEAACLPFAPRAVPGPLVPLRLVLGGGTGTVVLRRSGLVLGRHTRADVRLPLPDVSRFHCRFVHEAGRWAVIDLDSLNGIYVNGERVAEAELHHRDQLRIGGFVFEVDVRSGERTTPPEGEGADEPAAVLWSIASALDEPTRRAS